MSRPPPWLMLFVSLAGRSPTARMRLWRALKAAGAEPLRDGVYVPPARAQTAPLFQTQAGEVTRAGGTAYVMGSTKTPACNASANSCIAWTSAGCRCPMRPGSQVF